MQYFMSTAVAQWEYVLWLTNREVPSSEKKHGSGSSYIGQ